MLLLGVCWNGINILIASQGGLKVAKKKISLLSEGKRISTAVALNRGLTVATDIRISTQTLQNRNLIRAYVPENLRQPLTVEHCNRSSSLLKAMSYGTIIISDDCFALRNPHFPRCRIYIYKRHRKIYYRRAPPPP